MPASTVNELSALIAKMKKERASYEAKIAEIDAAFASLGIDPDTSAPKKRGPGRPRKAAGKQKVAKKKVTKKRAGRKKRGTFKKTGEQSVYDFVKANPDATSASVNKHWSGEGRGGRADNTLTKLVKEGKIKRKDIKGQRGGTYRAA